MSNLTPYRHNNNNMPRTLSNLFDDNFFAPFFNMDDFFTRSAASFRVDVKDKGDHLEMEAELPGVPRENIEIAAEDGVLTIGADYSTEKKNEDKKEHYVYSERRSGHVRRSFNIDGIKEDAISAKYDNGVLYVNLPKETPEDAPKKRKIDIQ